MSAAPFHPTLLSPHTPATEWEIQALLTLEKAGHQLAPIVIIPAALEKRFYRLNNLPGQLARIFQRLDLQDPDEDDVEDAVPAAQALLKKHYLLDETIDLFYAALKVLPAKVQVRRPEGSTVYTATRGRPVLMKVKQLWQDDWTFDAVMARLDKKQTFGLEARPVLLHGADEREADPEANSVASALLGESVTLWQAPEGVTRAYRPGS